MKLLFSLLLSVLALFNAGGVYAGTCSLPLSYLNSLDWTPVVRNAVKVGSAKAAPCDNLFASFIGINNVGIISYIDIAAALKDPTGTFTKTAKNCAKTVMSVLNSKLTPAQRRRAKNAAKCFKTDPSKLPKTAAAVTAFGQQLMSG